MPGRIRKVFSGTPSVTVLSTHMALPFIHVRKWIASILPHAFARLASTRVWPLDCDRAARTLSVLAVWLTRARSDDVHPAVFDRPTPASEGVRSTHQRHWYVQARELSYFVDSLDASFYQFVARRTHYPFFIPLSALLASVLFAVIFLAGVRRVAPNVDFVTGAVLLACFLTSFCFLSTMGVFYRSGKPVLSVVILAWLFHVHLVARRRVQADVVGRANGRDWSVALVLALVAGLLDRQGYFYVLTACSILFIHVRLTGELKDLLRATIAAAIILTLYNLVLAPVLIRFLNGYWPNFSYQRLPMAELCGRQVASRARSGCSS